eukprot:2603412-Rhodomonas_salina.1
MLAGLTQCAISGAECYFRRRAVRYFGHQDVRDFGQRAVCYFGQPLLLPELALLDDALHAVHHEVLDRLRPESIPLTSRPGTKWTGPALSCI